MMIWAVLALMTGAAVMAVLWPLSRRTAPAPAVRADTEFYRQQLAEIGRDSERGLISAAEADAARTEAARRLLRAADVEPADAAAVGEPALRRRRAVSALVLSAVPLLALAVYGAFGSPQLPGQPLAARIQEDPRRLDLAEALARIEAHLAGKPDDGRGWDVVAPVYLRLGRFADAARAYEAAIRLVGESSSRLISLGEERVSEKDGVVTAEAKAAFERALELEPGSPRARFHLALAAEQDNDLAGARSHYDEIVARSPPDAAWMPMVRERLSRLPGGAGAEAVAALPPEERQAAIRGMVEGLAARLESSGGTAEEWSRLVRSYAVLGEREKAQSAFENARRSLGDTVAQAEPLAGVAREFKLRDDGR